MISPCRFICDNKTSSGYCQTTVCIHPKYSHYSNCPPSHICSICFKNENPIAETSTTEFWICNECIQKIRNLIKKDE